MRTQGKARANGRKEQQVMTTAAIRATDFLGLNQTALADILGVSASTASRLMQGAYLLKHDKKEFELAALLVRVFRSLDAISGGDARFNKDWMQNYNTALGGVPADLVRKVTGLNDVVNYLDSRRAPV